MCPVVIVFLVVTDVLFIARLFASEGAELDEGFYVVIEVGAEWCGCWI